MSRCACGGIWFTLLIAGFAPVSAVAAVRPAPEGRNGFQCCLAAPNRSALRRRRRRLLPWVSKVKDIAVAY